MTEVTIGLPFSIAAGLMTITSAYPYSCGFCNHGFDTHRQVVDHLAAVHDTTVPHGQFVCGHCSPPQHFEEAGELAFHVDQEHGVPLL